MSVAYLSVKFPLPEHSRSVCWETLSGLVSFSCRRDRPCCLRVNPPVPAPLAQTQDTLGNRSCLQTSWPGANTHLLLKIQKKQADMFLLFLYFCAHFASVCVFLTLLGGRNTEASPSSRQTDRQCGRRARGARGARGAGYVGVRFTSLGVPSAGR